MTIKYYPVDEKKIAPLIGGEIRQILWELPKGSTLIVGGARLRNPNYYFIHEAVGIVCCMSGRGPCKHKHLILRDFSPEALQLVKRALDEMEQVAIVLDEQGQLAVLGEALSSIYKDTLAIINQEGTIVIDDLAKLLKITAPAATSRVRWLFTMGLIEIGKKEDEGDKGKVGRKPWLALRYLPEHQDIKGWRENLEFGSQEIERMAIRRAYSVALA